MAIIAIDPQNNSVFNTEKFFYDGSAAGWIDRYSLPAFINGAEQIDLEDRTASSMNVVFGWQDYSNFSSNSDYYPIFPDTDGAQVREVHQITGTNLLGSESAWRVQSDILIVEWRSSSSSTDVVRYQIMQQSTPTPVSVSQFYDLPPSTLLSGSDTIIGGRGDDLIFGYAGNDVLIGNAGSDRINGGLGADQMTGGIGHDKFWVDNAGDSVYEMLHDEEDNFGSDRDEDVVVAATSWTATAEQHIEVIIANGVIGSTIFGYVAPSKDAAINLTGNEIDNNLLGNSANNRLTGAAGDDILFGSSGDDVLLGGDGDDVLIGGLGKDSLNGGEGSDYFMFNRSESVSLGFSIANTSLVKYTGGTDSFDGGVDADGVSDTDVVIMGGTFADYSLSRIDSSTYKLIANSGGEIAQLRNIEGLWFGEISDAGPSEDGTYIDLASLTIASDSNDVLQAPDDSDWTIDGLKGNDRLTGLGGDDTIRGGIGNDILNGGEGFNTLRGDAGNDIYVVDYSSFSGGDTNIYNAIFDAAGADSLSVTYGAFDDPSASYYINLRRGGANGADFYIGIRDGLGESSGLDGWYGKTTIAGQFTFSGGKYANTIEKLSIEIPGVLDGDSFGNMALAAGSTLTNLKGVSNLSNLLMGFGGDNTLTGGSKGDILSASRLDTAEELNVYNAQFGTSLSLSNIEAQSSAGLVRGDVIIAGAGNDDLNGYYGNDRLDGGLGNDVMKGWQGNDTYVVDSLSDLVIEQWNSGIDTGGIDTVEAFISYTLLGLNVENLKLMGTGNINGTGNALDNTITGNKGANRLFGGLGNDIIYAGDGNDYMEHVDEDGDLGEDSFYGGKGNDTYIIDALGATIYESLNEGADIVYTQLTSYTLGDNIENLYHDDENPVDFAGTGNSLNNWIRSTAGNDTLYGLGGVDKIEGGAGNDLLDGGLGADTLIGGVGDDIYVVDNIKDVTTEAVSAGADEVRSSIAWTLGNNLENLTLTGASNINGTGNLLNNTITGNEGNNTLNGGAGNDTLYGAAGSDTLIGGLGNDMLTGGADNDTFFFNSAISVSTENIDTITDFTSGDKIQFSQSIFKGLTKGAVTDLQFYTAPDASTAQEATDRIIYNQSTGALYYDADGSATKAAPIQIAIIGSTEHPVLEASDLWVV